MVVAVGLTLRGHLRKGEDTGRVEEGGWAAVVLQEQSTRPIQAPSLLDQVIRQFNAEVAGLGKTLALGAESRSGRPYRASVHTVIST